MERTGIANLPLHHGKAPKWLFKRMVLLSKSIIDVIAYEYGTEEFLKRMADPFWFQALSCVLGYDWHSSGTTTVTCGVIKEAIDPEKYGIAIAGGKGKASRKTIQDIQEIGDIFNLSTHTVCQLQYSSKMAAKIDNAAVQDGYNLYHHVLLFSENKKWIVIQQGMNDQTSYARRYHWFSDNYNSFVCEPHDAIMGDLRHENVLDMTSRKSVDSQKLIVDLVNENPNHIIRSWADLNRHPDQKTLDNYLPNNISENKVGFLNMPKTINWSKMKEIYDFQPKNYEEFLSIKGVGPNTVRALALISDLIYGEKPSWSDPVKYSFTVGGKDGVPFPVDKDAMDKSTEILKQGIEQAMVGDKEKIKAVKRLKKIVLN